MTTIPKNTNIKIDDLLVGENEAMNVAAAIWGLLYKLKQPYLASFIARMEKDTTDMTEISMPLFKMIAGFAQMLQEYANSNERLMKALDEAKMRNRMRGMFGIQEEEPEE